MKPRIHPAVACYKKEILAQPLPCFQPETTSFDMQGGSAASFRAARRGRFPQSLKQLHMDDRTTGDFHT